MERFYYLDKDFTYHIDDKLNVCFIKNATNEKFVFPTLFKDKKNLKVPDTEIEIKRFLYGKTKTLEQEKVEDFLEIMDLNLLYFVISLLDKSSSDIIIYKDIVLVNVKSEKRCVFFTGKMLPQKALEKLYTGIRMNNLNASYMEACEEIIPYVCKKVTLNIESNSMNKEYADRIKPLQLALSAEAGATRPDLAKILSIYNSILKVRSDYITNEEVVFTEEEIAEIKNVLGLIKQYMGLCTVRMNIKKTS